jgi:hypothetical protein
MSESAGKDADVAVDHAFSDLFDGFAEMPDLDATWLVIAAALLKFCAQFSPSPDAWHALDVGEPWNTITTVQAIGIATMAKADPLVQAELEQSDGGQISAGSSSFMSKSAREALRDVALAQAGAVQIADRSMALTAIARGLAGSLDELAGDTFIPWFRARGEVTLQAGEPYPVTQRDPRPWIEPHHPNTAPDNQPNRDLAWTPRLRIAEASSFNYVIDFDIWNRLSPLGAEQKLTVAAAQPNLSLSEFDISHDAGPPATLVNKGPIEVKAQAERIALLADRAHSQSAQLLVLPEYTFNDAVHGELVRRYEAGDKLRPLIVCAGTVDGPDETGSMTNEGMLIIHTAGTGHDYTVKTPAKLHPATVFGAVERIRPGIDIRVFVTERWTMCVLICRDGMDHEIITQLALIGVNLLIIPAMSPKTQSLVSSATELCNRSQAFVTIANGPADWATRQPAEPRRAAGASRHEGIFAGPYGQPPDTYTAATSYEARTAGALTVWTFNFDERLIKTDEVGP